MMQNVSDYLYAKASANKIPLAGAFELSPVCNYSCRMCYVRKTHEQIRKEGKQLIPWEKWLELAKQCREAGTLYLLLTGGEPFLYPGFRQLYTELHRMGFIIYINSNGSLIDEETVEWLKTNSPGRINITLYGASAQTYQRICGNAAGFEKTMNAIRMLTEAKIPLAINASMIPENECDLEKIIAIGKEFGVNVRMSTYMFPPMRREKEAADSRFTPDVSAQMFLRKIKCQHGMEEYLKFADGKLEDLAKMEDCSDVGEKNFGFMRCRAGRSSFWVNWEGTMNACGMMDFPLGTRPFEEPLRDCWMRLTNAVRTTPVLKGCLDCEKREICNPCVAMIYGETGTVDQKAPYLCEMTERTLEIMKQEREESFHE